ncbi:ribonuclease [Clostridium sp. 19966]|uniref:ribonuclease n=1 Tax=Clostridium sp. 19966 TaxID=2768166 RepID=UPI0028DF39A7|nr:ribonuclease domain-containing protein [Clostridium sp. 19966]MDT8718018.1 ribonuclease [Clostridium sp. 19966]
MKKIFKKLSLLMIVSCLFISIFSGAFALKAHASNLNTVNKASYNNVINDFQGVADYIHEYRHLPSNYITKAKAQALGWRPGEDLWDYAPGKSIGGDVFTNSEGVLPKATGRTWHECDINYNGGHRGADRLVYSNDGLIYGTSDHYQTFTCYYRGY